MGILILVTGCSTPVRNLSQQQLLDGQEAFSLKYESDLAAMAKKSQAALASEYQASEKQSFDILVLSGGGPLGAFGAGFLKGWGRVKDSEFARPDFDSVSGISTGALIAPFAFVGTDDAYDEIVNLYANPDEDMVVARSLFSFLTNKRAYYDASVLHQRIKESITPDLIEAIAAKGKHNKVLAVGATNIDYGVMRVWDLSDLASEQSSEDVHKALTEKLIASSAIPSAFPPINIDGHLYVDGGASMQVVSGIEDRSWLYDDDQSAVSYVKPDRPLRIRIWVIINNKLMMDPVVVRQAWSSIAARSLVSLMRGSTLQSIQDIETFSQLINRRDDFDVQMHFVAIPQDYEVQSSGNLFDREIMQGLVELGEQMGTDTDSWRKRALRPGASILDN
jgi:hypothetical protein